MSDNIEFFYNEETNCWEKREEPYATIEIPTEKDFKLLMEKVDFYDKKHEEFNKLCYDYSKLQEQFADYQKASDKEIKSQVKQALKQFAEKVKEKALLHCKTINCYELKFIEETIDELLEEYDK